MDESSTPPNNLDQPTVPVTEPPAQPIASYTAPPQAPTSSRKPWLLILALVLVVAVLFGGYILYQKHAASKKFNDFALAMKTQEINGAKGYITAAATINEFSTLVNSSSSSVSPSQSKKLSDQVDKLNGSVAQACKDAKNDLTPANTDKRLKGTKLNEVQVHYVSDAKKILAGLASTPYSNSGLCEVGPAISSLVQNFFVLLPGINTLGEIGDGSSSPSASQMATLKTFTTLKFADEDKLSARYPSTAMFLDDTKNFLSSLYNEFDAVQKNDTNRALKYDSQVTSLAQKLDSDGKAVDSELRNDDKKVNDAAIQASKTEITAIDYQKKHAAGNTNVFTDDNLPAFRIVEAVVTGYSDSHDGTYPFGSSITDIVKLDGNIEDLQQRGFLKKTTYSSLGNDRSGFSLQTKLLDGTLLIEKVDVGQQTV